MKWRVMLELIGSDGAVVVREVGGRSAVAEYAPRMIGLTLGRASICLLRCRSISFKRKRRTMAAADDGASAAARSGPSKISATGGWCRCSAR
jgi:hypothetical protein